MAHCPFLSNRSESNSTSSNLHVCLKTCALYTNQGCALKVLAESQYQISKKINSQNDKS